MTFCISIHLSTKKQFIDKNMNLLIECDELIN